jgi:tRNA(Ile)-lysidine synthase
VPAAEQPDPNFSDPELAQIFSFAAGEPHIALAVSGGSDSTALMVLAAQWVKVAATPPRIVVLTVDHDLRPESAKEAGCVLTWAKQLGFEAHLLRWEGRKPSSGLQAAAREVRYRLMSKWCRENGAKILATAHTVEDQAETVMMRLARGTGIEGLGGIAEQRELDGLILVRPLLAISRQRLRALLMSTGQAWIDDPSNENPAFERIRLRQALSTLATTGLDAAAFAETARRARRASDAISWAAIEFLEKHHRSHPEAYGEVDLQVFLKLPSAIRVRVLAGLILFYGPGSRAELAELERLASWFSDSGPPGKRATLGGCQIAVRKAVFLIGREPGRIDPKPLPLEPGKPAVWDGRFEIKAKRPDLSVALAGTLAKSSCDPDLPAFVQAGLPAIYEGKKPIWVFNGAQPPKDAGISIEFLGKSKNF